MSRKKSTAAAAPSVEPAAPVPAPLSAPPPVGRFELVEATRIVLSRTNPRKYFDPARMAELEASVREHGIIVPLIVRPHVDSVPGRDFELVAGERRLTAASTVGLDQVPVVIQELTDEQAFDVQLLENGQRTDIHPLEEADAFRHKRDHFHRSIEEIAQQTGKTPLYVTTRLKLTELCDAARKAFLEGKVPSAAIALLIARIPDEKLQRDALKSITEYGGEGMSYRQARDHVQREYMLELGRAPFSIVRADLVPEAGACTTCQKRTGNQRELFEDVESKDICTDPACYHDKVDAEWKARVAVAKDQDIEVMPAAEAKKLLPYESSGLYGHSGEYVDLARECYDDPSPRRRTYRQLLGGKGKAKLEVKPDVLIRHPHTGEIIEAVRKKGLEKRLRDAGHDFKAERKAKQSETRGIVDHDTAKWKEEQARREREAAIEERLGALVLDEASSGVRGMARESFDFWKLMVNLIVLAGDDLLHGLHEDGFFKRRDIQIDEDKDDEAKVILDHAATLGSASSVRGLAFELLAGLVPRWGTGPEKLRELLAGHFELDLKELKKRATAAVKEEEKAAAKEAKKGGKKKAAPDDAEDEEQ